MPATETDAAQAIPVGAGPEPVDFAILAAPRIQAAIFTRILVDAKSPAGPIAEKAWTAIAGHGVDPALALAVFQHESSFGKLGAAVDRRNWGNLRTSPNFDDDGKFVVYPSWLDGADDAARLLAIYGRNKIKKNTRTDTARTFPFVWAPSADGNRPIKYGEAIVAAIERFVHLERTLHPAAPAHVDAPSAPAEIDAARMRLVAAKNHTRVRTAPTLDGVIVRTVDIGFAAIAGRTVSGAEYTVAGIHSNRWVELVELDGVALAPPLFSAAVLWRKT